MTWDQQTPPREYAVALGYPDEDIRAVTVEPDGTIIVTVEASDGSPLQVLHEAKEG